MNIKRLTRTSRLWFSNNINNAHRRLSRKYKKYKERGYPPEMKNAIDELRKTYTELVNSSKENYLKTQGLKLLSSGMETKNIGQSSKGLYQLTLYR